MSFEIEPAISYKAFEKTVMTLAPIYQFHFQFHHLTEKDFFQFLPVLGFVEGLIYQVDEENELGMYDRGKLHWQMLIDYMKKYEFYDGKIEEELKRGEEILSIGKRYVFWKKLPG